MPATVDTPEASPVITATNVRPSLSRSASTTGTTSPGEISPSWLPNDDLFSGFTLLDLFVALESHVDLIGRRLRFDALHQRIKESTRELKTKATEAGAKAKEAILTRSLSFKDPQDAELLAAKARRRETTAERVEKEMSKLRERVSSSSQHLAMYFRQLMIIK